jgi:UDP-N-acetylmuramate--alanine ligase
MFFEKVKEKGAEVYYVAEPQEAALLVQSLLREGDLFITMGAGDNWKLGKDLFERY